MKFNLKNPKKNCLGKKRILTLVFLFLCAVCITALGGGKINELKRYISQKTAVKCLKGYSKKTYTDCEIYYTKKDEQYARLSAIIISDLYNILKKDFAVQTDKPIIIIYPNKKELKKALGTDKQTPIGAYKNGIIYVLSPFCYEGNDDKAYVFIKKGPVLHELVHYFVDVKTRGRAKRWFSEGAALYYEYKLMGEDWHKELDGRARSTGKLDDDYFKENEIYAYRKSFEFIRDEMEGRQGEYIAVLCEKYI